MKYKTTILLFLMIQCVWIISACKKEKPAKGIDKELLDIARNTSDFNWFKKSDALLEKSVGSGHPQPLLRTRYNSVAASQLDTAGRILTDAQFPEGSLIVKELYDNSTSLARYAILYKKSDKDEADGNGWVWGYINSDETVVTSAIEKGSGCIGCHSQEQNIDYMLMNKYYP